MPAALRHRHAGRLATPSHLPFHSSGRICATASDDLGVLVLRLTSRRPHPERPCGLVVTDCLSANAISAAGYTTPSARSPRS
ncbi:MAG TPA: hypothetical protein VN255_12120, partial [Mycobacterium sp.]|nr:hypothetical protein [Mycobacterium sp.]